MKRSYIGQGHRGYKCDAPFGHKWISLNLQPKLKFLGVHPAHITDMVRKQ